MTDRDPRIHIAIASDLIDLLDAEPLTARFEGKQRPGHVTIVASGRFDQAFRSALAGKAAGSERTDVFDARAVVPRLLSDLRIGRSRRIPVDIDAIAPRLREIRLPREIVEADELLAAVDLRTDPRLRPDILLSLWADLVSPVHRFGARISGHREGLTAELALARAVDYAIVIDRLTPNGPLMMVHGVDPIALEVIVLAFRQVRTDRPSDAPGPWEDPLVQRATELNLGSAGPADLTISAASLSTELQADRSSIARRIEAAAFRAGIDQIDWDRF